MILDTVVIKDQLKYVSIIHQGYLFNQNAVIVVFNNEEDILAFCKDLDDISNELRYLVEKREESEE